MEKIKVTDYTCKNPVFFTADELREAAKNKTLDLIWEGTKCTTVYSYRGYITAVTERGIDYLDRWEYNWNDNRSKEYIHGQIVKHYSHLPNFAKVNYFSYTA